MFALNDIMQKSMHGNLARKKLFNKASGPLLQRYFTQQLAAGSQYFGLNTYISVSEGNLGSGFYVSIDFVYNASATNTLFGRSSTMSRLNIYPSSDNLINFRYGSYIFSYTAGTELQNNTVHNITIVHNNGLDFFLDGNFIGNLSTVTNFSIEYIGRDQNYYGNATIKNFGIHRATDTEVQYIFDFNVASPDLVYETTGDRTVTAYNLTASDTSLFTYNWQIGAWENDAQQQFFDANPEG